MTEAAPGAEIQTPENILPEETHLRPRATARKDKQNHG